MVSFTVPHSSGLTVYGVWVEEDQDYYVWMEDPVGFVDFRRLDPSSALVYAVDWVEVWSTFPGILWDANG